MMTVFSVEIGEYSDHMLLGLFSTRELAERVMEHLRAQEDDDSFRIVEWTLDPFLEELAAGYRAWQVMIAKDGKLLSVRPAPEYMNLHNRFAVWPASPSNDVPRLERTYVKEYAQRMVVERMFAEVWAREQDNAIQIVNDQRAAYLASGQWKRELEPKDTE